MSDLLAHHPETVVHAIDTRTVSPKSTRLCGKPSLVLPAGPVSILLVCDPVGSERSNKGYHIPDLKVGGFLSPTHLLQACGTSTAQTTCPRCSELVAVQSFHM